MPQVAKDTNETFNARLGVDSSLYPRIADLDAAPSNPARGQYRFVPVHGKEVSNQVGDLDTGKVQFSTISHGSGGGQLASRHPLKVV